MAYTYDLTKLHAQVKDTLAEGQGFCIEIEVWDHAHKDGGVEIEVSIWDTLANQHFKAPTPDAALGLLRAHYATRDMQPADLGLVAVPTGTPVVEYGGSPMDNDG